MLSFLIHFFILIFFIYNFFLNKNFFVFVFVVVVFCFFFCFVLGGGRGGLVEIYCRQSDLIFFIHIECYHPWKLALLFDLCICSERGCGTR